MSFHETVQHVALSRAAIGLFLAAGLISCSSCSSLDTRPPPDSRPITPFQPSSNFSPQSVIRPLPIQADDSVVRQARFIVKFRQQAALVGLGRTFRQDPAAARRHYRAWAEDYKALRGLILVGASYSGELILALPPDDPFGRRPDDILSEVGRIPSLIYIERDSDSFGHSGGPK